MFPADRSFKSITMRNLLSIIALALCFTINAQTRVGLGAGVLEESNKLGLGIASTISFQQGLIGTGGIEAQYTYAIRRDNDFQELSLALYHEIIFDHSLSIKPKAGASRQVSGNVYPTFGLDILARASDRTQIVLGWQPTPRGHFRDPTTGWSLVTTMGVLIRL